MTRSITHELRDLRDLPYGVARTSATEAIARRVEAEGPREHLAEALLDLVEAYTFAGDGAKSFVTFARLQRLWDDNPELFDGGDRHNFFWEFKWIAADLADYPQISSAQAEAFLVDMERRFDLAGNGLSTVRMSRFLLAWWTGNPEVEAARLAWVGGLRDEYEDCEACTIGNQTAYFTETGDYARAVELGLTQHSRCNKEPACTHHSTALAALLQGDPALALQQHKLALATTTEDNDDNAPARAKCFELLARGGRLEGALRILRNHDSALLRHAASPLIQLRFLLGLIAGLSANLPAAATLDTGLRDSEMRTAGELHAWAIAQAEPLAAAFDARNGNDYYARQLARALKAAVAPQPLPDDSLAIGQALNGDGDSLSVQAALAAVHTETGAAAEASAAPGTNELPASSTATTAAAAGDALFARAEAELAVRHYATAATHYAEAAEAFVREGWIDRAGTAYAEAAQSAVAASDDEAANQCFARALPLLRSGGADRALTIAVLAAWAPVAARLANEQGPILELDALLAIHGEPELDGLTEDLAARRQAEWLRERATLRDTLARLIASAGSDTLAAEFDRGRAVAEATTAAEEFAQLGLIADASHAFWLAGRLQRELGDGVNAIWSLESAVEGFTAARARQERANVAGELIELLRETGQPEEADKVTAQLLER